MSLGQIDSRIFSIWFNHIKNITYLSIIFSIPILLNMLYTYFGFQFPDFMKFFVENNFSLLLFASVIYFIAGKDFHLTGLYALKNRSANMDSLVSLGTSVAYWYSFLIIILENFFPDFGISGEVYLDVASIVITLILLGKYFEIKAKNRSGNAIEKLLDLQAKKATVIRNGKEQEIVANEIQRNEIIIVKPGQKIPTDGMIIDGNLQLFENIVKCR